MNRLTIPIVILVVAIVILFLVLNTNNQQDSNELISPSLDTIKNIPYEDYTCKEIIPNNLTIITGLQNFLGINHLTNGLEIYHLTWGGYCENHAAAQHGEYSWVSGLFTCSGKTLIQKGVTPEGIVKRSYKINLVFNMDKRNCTYLYNAAGGVAESCEIISSDCSWKYVN